MLINEFTSADAQLALLKLLMDSTWEAILQNQEYSKQARKAASNCTVHSKPRVGKPLKQPLKTSAIPNALPALPAFKPPPAKQAQMKAQQQSNAINPPLNGNMT